MSIISSAPDRQLQSCPSQLLSPDIPGASSGRGRILCHDFGGASLWSLVVTAGRASLGHDSWLLVYSDLTLIPRKFGENCSRKIVWRVYIIRHCGQTRIQPVWLAPKVLLMIFHLLPRHYFFCKRYLNIFWGFIRVPKLIKHYKTKILLQQHRYNVTIYQNVHFNT